MLPPYTRAGFVLLVVLSSCSSPETRRAEKPLPRSAAASAPAVPPETAADWQVPAASPVAAARRRVATIARPLPARESATTLADPTPALAANATDSLHLSSSSLEGFFAGQAKPAQQFIVQPVRDTVLRAAEGTMVLVPAYAFGKTTSPDSLRSPVVLQVREFYSVPDMVLNNLSTQSGGQLLETGGMLHLEATAAGQPCALRPGKHLVLRMPTAQPHADMQFFRGVSATPAQPLDWRRPAPQLFLDPTGIKPCKFNGGNGLLKQQLSRNLAYSEKLRRQLSQARHSRPARRELRRLSRNLGAPVLAVMQVRFIVSETGQVLRAQPQGGVYAASMPATVRKALHKLPRWTPARWEGVAVPSVYRVSLRFTATGNVLVEGAMDRVETYNRLLGHNFVQAFERQYANDSTLSGATAGGISSYLFSTAELGWINCDRFINSPQPRVTFAVQAGTAGTDVKLIFKNIRSVLGGATQGAETRFANLPDGEPVTIIAIRRDGSTTYLASQETTIGARTEQNLAFRAVGLAELKAEIAQLDSPGNLASDK